MVPLSGRKRRPEVINVFGKGTTSVVPLAVKRQPRFSAWGELLRPQRSANSKPQRLKPHSAASFRHGSSRALPVGPPCRIFSRLCQIYARFLPHPTTDRRLGVAQSSGV